MKGALAMRKYLLALAIVAAWSNTAAADEVALDDILGRWCVADLGNFNTFSRTQLLVQFPNGSSKTLFIANVKVDGSDIYIAWKPPYVSTGYELSQDKRTLIQLPNVDETGKPIGDKGPRLELRRC
ncbi:MAG: hypothetical protein ABR863_00970 [Roseiarcus sp.]|jgi:hypothetical protein